MLSVDEARKAAEFILARVAEDEAAAKDVSADDWGDTSAWAEFGTAVAVHFDRHSPQRVLDRAAAVRRLAAELEVVQQWVNASSGATGGYAAVVVRDMLFAVTGFWKDHPDYKQKWGKS